LAPNRSIIANLVQIWLPVSRCSYSVTEGMCRCSNSACIGCYVTPRSS